LAVWKFVPPQLKKKSGDVFLFGIATGSVLSLTRFCLCIRTADDGADAFPPSLFPPMIKRTEKRNKRWKKAKKKKRTKQKKAGLMVRTREEKKKFQFF
jgi:hypothetical protein